MSGAMETLCLPILTVLFWGGFVCVCLVVEEGVGGLVG